MSRDPQERERDPRTRGRHADEVARERKDDLPSQRDTESDHAGRPPRGTQWDPEKPKKQA